MGKEKYVSTDSANIALALEKAGIKCTSITIKFDPQIERDVNKFVMEIEDAHKKAAKSKIVFRSSLIPTFQPSNP
ncbi:MAG: hypothetical protein US48_C0045G0002 [Candidatus Levybacteria bacterium GW2011_GWA2_37_36]|nr:MAG: hypothetical protein US43_C0042G0002 [Candidatus Levybacteria bacterium GW2011_GWA1_37_16]KKQ31789.1 MAG: hypothetical protein US48_C0045G0002 [Candidatus Levybacteria bacterium GW2011_GWA2_37_36]KKQ40956.1 MAG: hypothetical protein US59_C0042G0006 [Candidatus Levybacteria bacterium GW2011_GWB1_37_8]OGH49896.1 MAG: hypothetical protein A3H17_03430 [Candidatus Levybacteria bacterium RIFCSPLOWO2_12_FULL_37_14]